jgi:alkylation response protein AidB-like acyl-CoA dehydrogenase
MADFWILTARKTTESGSLMRDIDMFICDVNAPGQKIVVEEYFENLGLYQIPYGRNHIDVRIPEEQRLIPQTNGIQMLLDMLHRSRFQFPAMGLGFIKRNLDECGTTFYRYPCISCREKSFRNSALCYK